MTAYINSTALLHNTALAQSLAPTAKLIAVIKANAYGHGMVAIAKKLSPVVYGFAVARLTEALLLREQGITRMIVVLSPLLSAETLDMCVKHTLTVVIHTLDVPTLPEGLDYWINIDSGMHRLGLSMEEFKSTSLSGVLMTHFSSDNESKSTTQLVYFNQVLSSPDIPISVANSSALLTYPPPSHRIEFIRPGLMLYGVNPSERPTNTSRMLIPVMTLVAPIIAIRHIKVGETVGYNGTWKATRDSVIATVGIGYGDGYPRHAPNGTPVMLHGRRAPLVGSVSMDTLCINITTIPAPVNIGDKVELWGENISVNEIPNTFAYELLTGVSQRVKRVVV